MMLHPGMKSMAYIDKTRKEAWGAEGRFLMIKEVHKVATHLHTEAESKMPIDMNNVEPEASSVGMGDLVDSSERASDAGDDTVTVTNDDDHDDHNDDDDEVDPEIQAARARMKEAAKEAAVDGDGRTATATATAAPSGSGAALPLPPELHLI